MAAFPIIVFATGGFLLGGFGLGFVEVPGPAVGEGEASFVSLMFLSVVVGLSLTATLVAWGRPRSLVPPHLRKPESKRRARR